MDNFSKTVPWFLLGAVIIAASLYLHFLPTPSITPNELAPVNGRVVRMIERSPAETTYTGEKRLVTRKVEVARIFSPFGTSAGEVVARQLPMKITEGETPGINITPEGIITTKGGGTETSTGGFKWSVFDSIWSTIKGFLWIGGLGVGVLVLLYFLLPGAAPVISGIFRFIASLFPFVGSIVERFVAKFKFEIPLKQVVTGGQSVKEEIDKREDLTDVQKISLKELFNTAMQKKQDEKTQAVVKTIKTTL